jgi:hypothetical protein
MHASVNDLRRLFHYKDTNWCKWWLNTYSLPLTGLHCRVPPLTLRIEYCGISRPFISLSILSVIMLTTDEMPSDKVILKVNSKITIHWENAAIILRPLYTYLALIFFLLSIWENNLTSMTCKM